MMTTDEIKAELAKNKTTDWAAIAASLAPAFAAAQAAQGIVIQVQISAEATQQLAAVLKAAIAR